MTPDQIKKAEKLVAEFKPSSPSAHKKPKKAVVASRTQKGPDKTLGAQDAVLSVVDLLPGKGRILIRHEAGSIGGYPIYHKWRPQGKGAAGKDWVSSLDVTLSFEKGIPVAMVQTNCELFVFEIDADGRFKSPSNKIKSLEPSQYGFHLTFNNGLELFFSPEGILESIKSQDNETTKVYTDNLYRVTGWGTGNKKDGSILWNKNGTIAEIRSLAGWYRYTYKEAILSHISGKNGQTWQFVYDQTGRPIRVQEPGHSYSMTYDSQGRINILEDADGETLLVEYDKQGDTDIVHVWSSLKTHKVYKFTSDTTIIEEGIPF